MREQNRHQTDDAVPPESFACANQYHNGLHSEAVTDQELFRMFSVFFNRSDVSDEVVNGLLSCIPKSRMGLIALIREKYGPII